MGWAEKLEREIPEYFVNLRMEQIRRAMRSLTIELWAEELVGDQVDLNDPAAREWIAAACPTAVKALLAEIDFLRKQNMALQDDLAMTSLYGAKPEPSQPSTVERFTAMVQKEIAEASEQQRKCTCVNRTTEQLVFDTNTTSIDTDYYLNRWRFGQWRHSTSAAEVRQKLAMLEKTPGLLQGSAIGDVLATMAVGVSVDVERTLTIEADGSVRVGLDANNKLGAICGSDGRWTIFRFRAGERGQIIGDVVTNSAEVPVEIDLERCTDETLGPYLVFKGPFPKGS